MVALIFDLINTLIFDIINKRIRYGIISCRLESECSTEDVYISIHFSHRLFIEAADLIEMTGVNF